MLERGCRIICVNGGAISIRNSHVSFNTVIHAGKDAEIRINDSFISHNCTIVAKSKIIIGSNCLIAELVTIRDQNHLFSDRTKLIQDQGFSSKPIIIEENVWLGCKATILAGTTIGRNSIIGAHALVKGAVEENSLYAGIPAIKKKSF
jgi:acetyltransferase-like isoleucine patch superfamily enzyme